MDGFRGLTLLTQYGPQDEPLRTFYVPVLAAAASYDRAVGYFNARELAYAARGVAPFVAGGGTMRLIVGAELAEADVVAITEGRPLEDVLATRLTADPFGEGVGIVEQNYLQLMSYLAREGRLQIRVGVPLDANGHPLTYQQSRKYFHTKFGILTDTAGDKIAFVGSNNDTGPGWLGNHETFSVYQSWKYDGQLWADYGAPLEADFAELWEGSTVAGWRTLELPDALRQRLITYAKPDYTPPIHDPALPPGDNDPDDVDAARARLSELRDAPSKGGGSFVGVVTAPVEPLPHQLRIVHRAVSTYPRGYLLADEVGLGKTIEAGLILRELLLSERARKALILVPASVMEQWQEELWEKLALRVPRYDGKKFWDVDKTEMVQSPGTSPWNAYPVVLASSHLARRRDRREQLLSAGPWDVVLVDEAHHARRRGSKATATPNTLLSLLQDMRARGSWKSLYLASATPMQMNAHEAWDLINLFHLPGRWGQDASWFTSYYQRLREDARTRDWTVLTKMIGDYLSEDEPGKDLVLVKRVKDRLGFGRSRIVTDMHKLGMHPSTAATLTPTEVEVADEWLRRHTPMRDRVFRTTRQTMRDYQDAGILAADVSIPVRDVDDVFIPLSDDEDKMYRRIEDYISKHYNAYMQNQQKALGFIMTVYRRRLTSSFEAIRQSLQRRLHALEHGLALTEMLDQDDRRAVEETPALDPDENAELEADTAALMAGEIGELRDFINSLERLTFDSKADRLISDIRGALNTHNTVVVFTQYTDTMDYLRDQLAQNYSRIACYCGRGGELWDADTRTWQPVPKAKLKAMFREGRDIKILLGTDSMSEGLNLQTSGRLINVDMPWNFMRVEQRIGRVDRIGGHPVVEVSNYFYSGTVEEQVYAGIAEDYDWFTDIVGDAQPVLAAVEDAMSAAAMASPDQRDAAVAAQVRNVTDAVKSARTQEVKISDFSDTTVEPPPELDPATTLDAIKRELTTNPLTVPMLTADPKHGGVYVLHAEDGDRLVAFDRDVVDLADVAVELVTYGTPAMDALLNA